MPHAGPPWHHIRPEGLRTGSPQLTAGHGRPVCQPWWSGDKAEGQHPEAMCFAGSTPQNLQSTLIRIIRIARTRLRPKRRRALLEDASRRPAVAPHQARRVADRKSATDSRPWTACLSAVVERRQGRRAASGSDALRRFYPSKSAEYLNPDHPKKSTAMTPLLPALCPVVTIRKSSTAPVCSRINPQTAVGFSAPEVFRSDMRRLLRTLPLPW